MDRRKLLKQQVKVIKENEKCNHCGGDIRDQIMAPWQRKALREIIRNTKEQSDE